MSHPRILSVGQCAYDHSRLARHLETKFQAETVGVDDFEEAIALLRSRPFQLVLVNRVSDGGGAPGLDLIRTLKADPALAGVPVMLVSNYPEAQSEAQALGALPGFGKSELSTPKALENLAAALKPKD